MKYGTLLESLEKKMEPLAVRRCSLPTMISESYKSYYACKKGSNLQKLVEAHLDDVRKNPTDIDRLSYQLAQVKQVVHMVESGKIKDEDLLVPKEKFNKVNPTKETLDLDESADELDPEACRDEIRNTRSYGWKGTPFRQNLDHRDEEEEVYNRYKIRGESDIDSMDDDTARSMYKDISGIYKAHADKYRDLEEAEEETLAVDSDSLEDPELTDEEVAELTKHLEAIRKNKNAEKSHPAPAPKKEMEEGIKPRKLKRQLKEAEDSRVCQYGVDVVVTGDVDTEELQQKIASVLADAGINVAGCMISDTSWDKEEYGLPESEMQESFAAATALKVSAKFIAAHWKDILAGLEAAGVAASTILDIINKIKSEDSPKEDIGECSGRAYESLNLAQFNKKSASKAFVKTFKKLDSKLREGTALTRQESIALYKATNSALTHLSVELEHNPQFLSTFKESVSLLSEDAAKVLGSLKEGKGPSKATMKSLAKFSEALLREEKVYYPNGEECPENSVDMDTALDYMYGEDRDKDNSKYSTEKKQKAVTYWVERTEGKRGGDLSEAEEEELPPIEDEEEVAVAEEGEEISEEEEEFDQEYAEARVKLHKDMVKDHEEDEEPAIQEKIRQDAEEVVSLPGISDEDAEEIYQELEDEGSAEEGEESEEAPEEEEEVEESAHDEDVEEVKEKEKKPQKEFKFDDEITDDELAELKKFLTEMRKAKNP